MATERRQRLLLGSLLLVLAFVVYRALASSKTSAPGPAASNRSRAAGSSANQGMAPVAPDVHLDALESERPAPVDAERNVFRFKPKAPPPSTATRPGSGMVAPGPPPPPPGPPPLPPIPLKFIGTIVQGGKTVAVLSDGQGPPMHATEGGTVAGRYRVLRIGVESIELSYLDGRGRQTIRQTGG